MESSSCACGWAATPPEGLAQRLVRVWWPRVAFELYRERGFMRGRAGERAYHNAVMAR